MAKKISKDKWVGLKFRNLPEYNYSVIWNNLVTVRLDKGDVMELPPDKSEFYDVSLGNKCSTGKCNFCLTSDNFIKTKNGDVAVHNIKINDLVYSLNNTNNSIELKPVLNTSERFYEGDIIEISIENTVLRCTPNHKVYTTNRGYVRADNLHLEDDIVFF